LLDLAVHDRQFVTISPSGWHVASTHTPLFQTSRSAFSLPTPVDSPPAAAFAALQSCLNVPSRPAFLRCLAWLLAAMRPSGPFPFLTLQGPPSSGKSFAARLLRALIDPNAAPLLPFPHSIHDLLTAARQNWVLAFDHVSSF